MFEIFEKYNFWDKKQIFKGFFREFYINKYISYLDSNLIKVIIGQRRVGKSYIMRMLINYLIHNKKVNPKNTLYINKELFDLNFINDDKSLVEAIKIYKNKLKPKGKVYILIDEIQEIRNWEKVVNSLNQDYTESQEIFISGSNSNLLSNELATYLTGRYIQFEVFPFSYKEYLNFFKLEKCKKTFLSYIKSGGMPETYNFQDDELKRNYISTLKDSILLKDIVSRHKIRDAVLLENLLNFIIDSVGSYFSVNKIVNFLLSNKIKTNNETIAKYLQFIEQSFLIHSVCRYNLKGKEVLLNEKKYYLNDLGFKFFLSTGFDFSPGKFIENLVYIYLKRIGYAVSIGKINGKEIDFIAEKNDEKKYIQVSYLLDSEKTIKREFSNLLLINDNYKKIVTSFDEFNSGNYKGIEHIPVWEFVE